MRLGLDIGGSTIRATVVGENDEQRDYVFSVEANPSSSKKSMSNLKMALDNIGIKSYELISCGMAGGFQQSFSNAVKEVLLQFSQKVYVFPDVVVVHFTYFEGHNGIVSVAGTGSSSYGKYGERELLYGGLGYAISDVGSGFFIGKKLLSKALYDIQLGVKSNDSKLVQEYFKETNPHIILEKIYNDNSVKVIADFSKFIIKNVPHSDEIKFAAESLAEEVMRLAKALEFSDKLQIGVSGGVFEHSEFFYKVFFDHIGKEYEVIKYERKYSNTIASLRKVMYEGNTY